MQSHSLPLPSATALQYSQQLQGLINAELTQQGGRLNFARFMELALYAPGYGYYSAGLPKLGKDGDFVTAPEISPLFAICLARQCQQVLNALGKGDILEFGAGTGVMAADILLHLEHLDCLPEHYFIIEVSADLQLRQHATLKQKAPHLLNRVQWLTRLPAQPLKGVFLANEVVDAFPIHRFRFQAGEYQEFYVSLVDNQWNWLLDKPSSPQLQRALDNLRPWLDRELSVYDSEINLVLPAWLSSVSQCLQQGLILVIDYGFPRAEYYHPDRSEGTLMCHYRQLAHTNPLLFPGLQDITCHVDFTALAESALRVDLEVAGFSTQAAFLLGCGILEQATNLVEDTRSVAWRANQQLQLLLSPSEMGELCKVMGLTRQLSNMPLLGFTFQDQRQRL